MQNTTRLFLKFLIIFTVILSVLTACGIGTYMFTDTELDSSFNSDDVNLNLSTLIYYTNDEGEPEEYQQLSGQENRIWADLEHISPYVQDAFIAIEDERFWSHPGFDLKRLLGATMNFIFKGKESYGGSTITQQLIKNLTGEKDVAVSRKIKEIFRAIKLEKQLSKEEILELYLNTIYLGQGCNGVKTAARVYYSKDVSELNLSEAASLAGITQFPSKYDPIINPDANLEKQKVVLAKMLELEYITEDEYEEALAFPLTFNEGNSGVYSNTSYFMDTLIDEVIQDLQKEKGYAPNFAAKLLYNGGLRIYSTVDPDVQRALDQVYQNDANFPKASGEVKPESAMVVLDPSTGAIKGIVGGRGSKTASRTLNRAKSLRQPGSVMKPIAVYAPAIEENLITPGTIVEDKEIVIGNWKPQNFYTGFKGDVTIRYAIEQSINTVAIQVLQKLGVDESFDFLTKKLHITSLIESEKRDDGNIHSDKNLSSLALGGVTDGISALEIAAAYATFANEGVYITPHSYTKIVDRNGNVILEKDIQELPAMREKTASIVTNLLEGVVTRGTGMSARLNSGMPVAGKTGTTDDSKDLWFSGYTPYYCGVVWFGYDIPQSMNHLNSATCVSVWKKVMDQIHVGKTVVAFPRLKGVDYSQGMEQPKPKEEEESKEEEEKEIDDTVSPTPSEGTDPQEPSDTPIIVPDKPSEETPNNQVPPSDPITDIILE